MSQWNLYRHGVDDAKKYFYKVFPVLEPGYWTRDYDESKYNAYTFFSQIPPFKYQIAYDIGRTQNEEYLNRYGLGYEDIHYPQKMPGSGAMSSSVAGTLNFVSSNLTRLYR